MSVAWQREVHDPGGGKNQPIALWGAEADPAREGAKGKAYVEHREGPSNRVYCGRKKTVALTTSLQKKLAGSSSTCRGQPVRTKTLEANRG